jgi:polyisoprenoid-binding protein YceI
LYFSQREILAMRRLIGIGILGVMLVVGIVFAYIWISGGSGEASEEISAPTLEVPVANNEDTSESSVTIFSIVPESSEVRFIITEELRGQPTTVIGSTNQVAGDIGINFANPSASQLGTIRINVRTLETDSALRNRTIRGQVLLSAQDQYEFAEFVPTALSGLPDTVSVGAEVMFQIVGDLTVRGVTNSVTFETTVMITSENQISGLAKAQVLYRDFGMSIPRAAGVANVSDEVTLEIEFVAIKPA